MTDDSGDAEGGLGCGDRLQLSSSPRIRTHHGVPLPEIRVSRKPARLVHSRRPPRQVWRVGT